MRVMELALAVLAICQAPGNAGTIDRAREEIERIARAHTGTASAEDLERMRRLRDVLSRVSRLASGGAEEREEIYALLAETARRRERTVAMEAALALIGVEGAEGVKRLLASVPAMDSGVRARALDFLEASGRPLESAAAELLGALAVELDAESLVPLIRMARGLRTLESARAILAAVPSLGAIHERRRLEPVVDAAVDALALEPAAEVRAWLGDGAFGESRAGGKKASGRLFVLCRVASRTPDPAMRRALEALLACAEAEVGLAACSALEVMGTAPSREALENAGRCEAAPPRSRAACAAALGRLVPEGPALLIAMSGEPDWRLRREATRALRSFASSDAAFRRLLAVIEADPTREVRRAAYGALRSFPRPEAVERLIALLAPLRSRDRTSTIEYLEWATGKTFGRDRSAWTAWWEEAREEFVFPESEAACAQ